MAIITISRELAALGEETARELAKVSGYRFVERSAIEERIRSFGVDTKIEKYDEKKPSLQASFSGHREDYLHFLKTAVFEEAAKGNCIFIGRGAVMILKGVPGVFHVFLDAPKEIRVERVKSYFHCDEKRAKQILHQADTDRTGFHHYFFDINWKDSANYHLVMNTGLIHPVVCASLIKSMHDSLINDEAEKQHMPAINELFRGHQIKHHILYDKKISVHFLEVQVSGDKISLFGAVKSQAQIEAVISAAREAAPDCNVHSEIQVVQEYNVIP